MLIFSFGGLAFYKLVRLTITRQIDSSLITEKEIIEEQIFNFDSVPDFTPIFGHQIEVNILNHPLPAEVKIHDTSMIKTGESDFSDYRYLCVEGNMPDKRGYEIHIFKSLDDTHKLITGLFEVIFLVFLLLSLILILVNYWISKKVWAVFYQTLAQLRNFNIIENRELNLAASQIEEFDQLNRVLNSMSEKIRADFINLKEFTEDASHEIQTPLSIIKSKLELLFQSENLTKEEIENIRSIYEAANRLSKLNHSLLLISRIQNQQYSYSEKIDLARVLDNFLDNFKEIIEQKNISISKNYQAQLMLHMNPGLAEILVSNLLGNAIKHNMANGEIMITLTSNSLTISNEGKPFQKDTNVLFNRFEKGDSMGDSAGLGLSIVKKITALYKMGVSYSTQGARHILRLDFF